jgi:hypothetical protein
VVMAERKGRKPSGWHQLASTRQQEGRGKWELLGGEKASFTSQSACLFTHTQTHTHTCTHTCRLTCTHIHTNTGKHVQHKAPSVPLHSQSKSHPGGALRHCHHQLCLMTPSCCTCYGQEAH